MNQVDGCLLWFKRVCRQGPLLFQDTQRHHVMPPVVQLIPVATNTTISPRYQVPCTLPRNILKRYVQISLQSRKINKKNVEETTHSVGKYSRPWVLTVGAPDPLTWHSGINKQSSGPTTCGIQDIRSSALQSLCPVKYMKWGTDTVFTSFLIWDTQF